MAKLKDDLAAVDLCFTLVAEVADQLNLKTPAAREFLRYALANTLLMDRKQQDYGPGNIAGFGTFGVVVRMNDKMERLKTLYNSGRKRRAVNESIQDTFRDISNYGNIALMVDDSKWPKV